MKKTAILVSLFAIVILGGLFYIGWQRRGVNVSGQGVAVAASFYPWAEFARQVGGDLVRVTTVVPAGSEPHDYEPMPQEMAAVYDADIFIYNGSGIDPWAERVAPDLRQKGVRVINMSDTVSLLSAPTVTGQPSEGQYDPHFWLDPVLVAKQIGVIRDALAAVDPAQAAVYGAQTDAYAAQLAALDREYRSGLQSCALREIVTSHAAFGYLARRYNLSVINIAGLSPEEEPSARTLSDIAQLARQKNIKYIFFETLVSPKLAQTVAAEIGAQTLVFNPLEGLTDAERQAGDSYISIMRDNLQNLRMALECQ
ncbi:MAG: zinc ABC transporter substrate-binding protein [Candidatus Andersenbacteria bacterium]|nr:zinc ABC transporter substrate-binding protein [bacterium]MDZ4225265.1 zinc ABC transporter substrate-binding protein [Candidatus Andersenbacteria bacterium]